MPFPHRVEASRSAFAASVRVATVLALFLPAGAAPAADTEWPLSGPITGEERHTAETPRDMPAADWSSAYCAKWTDGCTTCERKTANDEPVCETAASARCTREPIKCRASLSTIARVCVRFNDGCNDCITTGACSAVACLRETPEGAEWLPSNFTCTTPRRPSYEDPWLTTLDLVGVWRLIDPDGRSCQVVLSGSLQLHWSCLSVDPRVMRVRVSRVDAQHRLQLLDANETPVFTFATSALDALDGEGDARGFRMVRIEAEPPSYPWLEGAWELRMERLLTNGKCQLFLKLRTVPLAGRDWDKLYVPDGVTMTSRCTEPLQPRRIGESGATVRDPAFTLPAWTAWDIQGLNIVLRDASGETTTFRPGADEGLVTDIPRPGGPALTATLHKVR
jgi:hypothetical protein